MTDPTIVQFNKRLVELLRERKFTPHPQNSQGATDMTNLLAETLSDMNDAGLTPGDVVFIGSEASGHSCTWDEFAVLADKQYDAGFGSAEVATDLQIVFRDGTRFYRAEYDGSEWWEVRRPFVMPAVKLPIASLFCIDYEYSLSAIQNRAKEQQI